MDVKWKIMYHFRILQRCRTWDNWPEAECTFLQQVQTTVMSQTQEDDTEAPTGNTESNATQGKATSTRTQSSRGRGRHAGTLSRGRGGRRKASKVATENTLSHTDAQVRVQAQWEYLRDYFKVNWFTQEWIRGLQFWSYL